MKKVDVLCRPDHSLMIMNNTDFFKVFGYEVKAYTFNAAYAGSPLKNLVKKITEVPKNTDISNIITVAEHVNRHLVSNGIDSGYYFYKFCNLINSFKLKNTDADLLHIWPMYAYGEWLSNLGKPLLLDCYEANPYFVDEIYRKEYERCGFEYNSTRLFRHEHNFETLNQIGKIVTPSKYVVDSYKGHINSDKFHINPYGLLGHEFSKIQSKQSSNKKVFTFLGRVCLEKGILRLLDVAEKLRNNKQIEFKIIGPIDSKIKKVLINYDLSNVRFVGAVPKNKVKEHLSQSDFFVMPSLSDAYCIAVIEALSVGLPVIVTNRTGCCEIIEDNDLGVVIDIDSPSALEAAILGMCSLDSDDYLNIQSKIQRYFEIEGKNGYQKRMLDIYSEVVKDAH
ncbi:glycosyltransferase family 4 protein [Proteus terrae]|uniref:glycosyltransferase family 4 protein n=1 Tax=Proteus terrae TaxID=1574161 RepID=UPI001CBDDC49|nr:glycosyltransferase family 4 protein [Proteus terrae]